MDESHKKAQATRERNREAQARRGIIGQQTQGLHRLPLQVG